MSERWFEGPLLGFDTETTGVAVDRDRIVQAALVSGTQPGIETPRTWLIDPGVPIPPGATRVHGITDEQVRGEGLPPAAALTEVAAALRAAVDAGVPVVAFRAGFDCTLLSYELERHGIEQPDWARMAVVDPSVLDKRVDRYRRGKRTLGATAAHYGVPHSEAHSAAGDAIATVGLARAIGATYPEVGGITAPELHAAQVLWHAEDAASLEAYFRKKGRDEAVERRWPLCR
ncbi:exonuclease domain-containing protein [Glycomyces luteolus]|uniref:Exonuclease domain-containing protein n=1 Tax=Glycomyces luteolus TaxID=2670330 RepID=A0A9X3PHW1_9ACTN|nr:exonuclease domain-containing protein [Glycomyces luteolus]MDA1362899.1 exonuclease domain-containing protein [Glycomyces luteolus]